MPGFNQPNQPHRCPGVTRRSFLVATGMGVTALALGALLFRAGVARAAPTGRHPREGPFPTIGSWITYGLGTLNRNLPEYIVLGSPTGDCCGGSWTHGAAYLGPEYAGVRLNGGGREPLPFVAPAGGVSRDE